MAKSWRLTRISRWNGLRGRRHAFFILFTGCPLYAWHDPLGRHVNTAHVTGRGSFGVTPRDALRPVVGSRSIAAVLAGPGNLRAAHASEEGARKERGGGGGGGGGGPFEL